MAVFKIRSASAAAAPELDLSSDTNAASWIPASSAEMQKQPVFAFRCSFEQVISIYFHPFELEMFDSFLFIHSRASNN
jgi:hypothetical protein